MSGDVKMEPCPFCGCDPVFAYSSGSVSGVRCPQCDARTGYCDQQQAIAAWNRRSSSAAERAVVEALEYTLPLARLALEECRCSRIKAGHRDITFTKRDGVEWSGLYQSEYDKLMAAEDALSSVRGEGGDKQARSPSALSAPISTDTKGTTK